MTTSTVRKAAPKKRVCIYITEPAYKKLKKLSTKNKLPASQLVEQAIRDCLQ